MTDTPKRETKPMAAEMLKGRPVRYSECTTDHRDGIALQRKAQTGIRNAVPVHAALRRRARSSRRHVRSCHLRSTHGYVYPARKSYEAAGTLLMALKQFTLGVAHKMLDGESPCTLHGTDYGAGSRSRVEPEPGPLSSSSCGTRTSR